MIIGQWKAATIALSGTTSDAVDVGREYEKLLIYLPVLTSATIKIQAAEILASTYADIYTTDKASGNQKQVITTATTGEFMWIAPIGGFKYIKIVSSVAQGAERAIRICGIRD